MKREDLLELFQDSELWLEKADAQRQLQSLANVGRTAAYEALKLGGGRYSEMLRQRADGKIGLLTLGTS